MIRNILILAVILGAIGLYTLYEDRQAVWTGAREADKAETVFVPAPDFEFTSQKGKDYSLSDFKGKVIVLNFWASWCAPCVVEFPQMLELASLKKDKAVFIFMSVDDDKKNMDRFLSKLGKSLNQKNVIVAHDADKHISQTLFQTYKLPETFLIGPDATLQDKVIGAVPWNELPMQQKIDGIYSAR